MIDSEAGLQTHSELAADIPGSGARREASSMCDSRANYICMQPFWFPSLFADGTLVACEQDFNARRPLGVLEDNRAFADVWFSGAAAEVRKQIRYASHTLSFCSHCPARYRATTDTSVRATWLRSGIRQSVVIGG
jgi:hypothetical protein